MPHRYRSISGDASHRSDVIKMANFLNDHLRKLGVETQLTELGKHVMDDQELDLPPAILGRVGNDPKKKTVLVYGHFDVQPVSVGHHPSCSPYIIDW
jgi:Cys-Gly metallodipeptidase DUG1